MRSSERPVQFGFAAAHAGRSLPVASQSRLPEAGFAQMGADAAAPLLAVAGLLAYFANRSALCLVWVLAVAAAGLAVRWLVTQFCNRPAEASAARWVLAYQAALLCQAAIFGAGGGRAADARRAPFYLLFIGPLNFVAAVWGTGALTGGTARLQMLLLFGPFIAAGLISPIPGMFPAAVLATIQMGAALALASHCAARFDAGLAAQPPAAHNPLAGHPALPPAATDFQRLLGRCQITVLLNRHSLAHLLALDSERAYRAETHLSLLLLECDIPANDDARLAWLGRRLKDSLRRTSDALASLGGGRFAVLLPYTDAFGADAVARNLQAALRSPGIDEVTTDLAASTFIGTTTYCGRGLMPEGFLLRCAEQALTAARQRGPGQISRYDAAVAVLQPAPYQPPGARQAAPVTAMKPSRSKAGSGQKPPQDAGREGVVQLHQHNETKAPAGANHA